jgi:hypothetical protein
MRWMSNGCGRDDLSWAENSVGGHLDVTMYVIMCP